MVKKKTVRESGEIFTKIKKKGRKEEIQVDKKREYKHASKKRLDNLGPCFRRCCRVWVCIRRFNYILCCFRSCDWDGCKWRRQSKTRRTYHGSVTQAATITTSTASDSISAKASVVRPGTPDELEVSPKDVIGSYPLLGAYGRFAYGLDREVVTLRLLYKSGQLPTSHPMVVQERGSHPPFELHSMVPSRVLLSSL